MNREFLNKAFSLKALGFMSKVRAYVMREKIYEKVKPHAYAGLRLIDMRGVDDPNRNAYWDKCDEVDLNKAYWVAAHKVGVISDEIFQEGLSSGLSKIELLACIGTMAKVQKERSYDGQRYQKSVTLQDSALTKHIWRAVSYQVDKCMQDCARALGKEFLFYWTDAVFFHSTPANKALVDSAVKAHGFESKLVKVECLTRSSEGHIIAWTKHFKGNAQEDQVLRDASGNYGRVFVYINNQKTFLDKINEGRAAQATTTK